MAAYTTNDKVRAEAGFAGNTNIDEAEITDAVNAAHSVVVGVVSQYYTMPLSYTPAILELIERRLAAGYLLSMQYGEQAEGTSKEGANLTEWALEQLDKVSDGSVQLLDASDVVLARNQTAGMEGYPLISDPDDEEAGERKFSIDMEF
jgi:phage gp36-like protein